jgi:stromal membrane-associated protein
MHLGPSRSASSQLSSSANASSSSATLPTPPARPATAAATLGPSTAATPPIQNRSASLQVPAMMGTNSQQLQYGVLSNNNNPLRPSPLSGHPPMRSASQPLPQQQPTAATTISPSPLSSSSAFPQPPSSNPVWNDLVSLQGPSQNSSLPLQMTSQPMAIPNSTSTPAGGLGLTPHNPFAMQLSHSPGQMMIPQATGMPSAFGGSANTFGSSMPGIAGGIGTGLGLGVTGGFGGGGGSSNPFHQQQLQQQSSMSLAPSMTATNSSPFNPFTGMSASPMPSQQPFFQQQQVPPVQPQPQPFGSIPQLQGQFLSTPGGHSPQPQTMFTQTPPPFGMGATPTFGTTPSPLSFQQQPPQMAPTSTGNPFTSWMAQGQQQQQQAGMGYGMSPGQMPQQQQHWGGM